MNNYLYHSSPIQELTVIEPRKSTHGKAWVYALENLAASALFLGKSSNFRCSIWFEGEVPAIYERFPGALQIVYAHKRGSIYKLAGDNFESGKTSWSKELVSTQPQKVIEEIKIDNALEFLEKLSTQGSLEIYNFDNPPAGAAKDKNDLIKLGIHWAQTIGEHTLDEIAQYHPDILDEVINSLVVAKFEFKSPRWQAYAKSHIFTVKDIDNIKTGA